MVIQSIAWKELGLDRRLSRQQEWAQFLELIGPPPDASVDAFRFGWIGDYVDAMNFLDLWTCDSGNNSTNYCDPWSTTSSSTRRPADTGQPGAVPDLYAQLGAEAARGRRRLFRSRRSTGTRTSSSRRESIKEDPRV